MASSPKRGRRPGRWRSARLAMAALPPLVAFGVAVAADDPATQPTFPSTAPSAVTQPAVAAEMVAPTQPATVATQPARLPESGVPSSSDGRVAEVVVHGRAENLLGIANTGSEGYVGAEQIAARPLLRPGEVLETVPGVVITQHSGAGKANQFFLRGYNLDHGTDLRTTVAGLPVNLPSHAHGQGYTDLNFIIPELVSDVSYRKGPYFADEGDFSSAGAIHLGYVDTLDKGIVTLEGGSYGYARGLVADSAPFLKGNLLWAFEFTHDDGPWDEPEAYKKVSGVLRYSAGTADAGYSVTALAYHGDWRSTDQFPKRAVRDGLIDRFGSLDPTDGGNSQRYAVVGEGHQRDAAGSSTATAFVQYYDLDLYSNFTYFLDDPVNGDQFEQQDRRVVSGLELGHTWYANAFGRPSDFTVGAQFRNDYIHNGLYHTADRDRLGVTRADRVSQTSLGLYVQNETRWTDWFRTVAGLRGDLYYFDVDSNLDENGGNKGSAIASPKLNLIFGPWAKTEVYLSGGLGFHSNDGRGVLTKVDPGGSGDIVSPASALVRTKGAEVGVRTSIVPGLQTTVSAWALWSDSELVFVGDAGGTEPSRPSRREGIEITNYWQVTDWLAVDADYSLSRARFTDYDPAGSKIPGAVQQVVAAGITIHEPNPDRGAFASLRLRYFGPRPLIEDGSVYSGDSAIVNAEVGYRFSPNLTFKVELLNLFDRKVSDIEYYYASRLGNEAAGPADGGYNDVHFHPAEPLSVRAGLTYRF